VFGLLLLPLGALAQSDNNQTRYQCSRWTTDNQTQSISIDQNLPFNSKEWITTQYFRRGMLADFLRKHPIIGMTRKEVKKRLGPPWRTGPDPLDGEYTDTGWYLLDGGFNGNAQTESFEVAYANGKVVAYRQIAQWQQ
jgi:hypothetical protein